MAEETLILNLEVDQGSAERQLEKIEGILLDNKKAVQDLQAAYKKGTITQEEYVKENIRLQQNIKKEQDQKKLLIKTLDTESNSRNGLRNRITSLTKSYDNLNLSTAKGIKQAQALRKEITELQKKLDSTNPKPFSNSFADAAKNINIAGVSVGDLGTKIAALANPITATVGIIGALGAAYAKSTAGAKDLEFAQNQLGAAFQFAANEFGNFISSAEDGEGILSGITTAFLARFAPETGGKALSFSLIQEQLQDLGREEIAIRSEANQLIERNQDLLETIADDQVDLNTKIAAANEIEKNLRTNKEAVLSVLVNQLTALTKLGKLNKDDEAIQTLIAQKKAEITKEGSTQEKQITRINKQQDDLNRKLQEERDLRIDILRTDIAEANAPKVNLSAIPGADLNTTRGGATKAAPLTDPFIKASKARTDQYLKEVKVIGQTEAQKREDYLKTLAIQELVADQQLETAVIAGQAATQIASIVGEQTAAYKVIASASTIISTYSAATKAYESAFLPFPTVASPALGAASAAAAIAQGLANLAQINGVQFAEGGYTGDGDKYEPKGVVHGGEFVIPKATVSQYGKEHFNKYLPQYADGGFVANQSTAPINQSLLIANTLKNMPPIFASWTEGQRIGKRLQFKEKLSSLK